MRRVFLVVGCLLILTTGCAPTIPDWVDGRSASYPDDAYLIGVGTGPDRHQAEDRARSSIAKIFSVQVQSSQTSSEEFWMNRLASGEKSSYQQSARSDLTTRTDRLLSGVQIVQVWEKQPRELYALATLDRGQVAHPLRQELAEIDLAINHDIEQGEASKTAIERLARYLRALQRFERRRQVAADLSILVPSGYVVASPYTAADIASRADREAAKIKIGLSLTGDEQGIVEGALISALARNGLKISAGQEGDLQLSARIELTAYRTDDRWNWVTAAVETRFLLPDGRPLDAMRNTVREGSQIDSRARTLALEKVGDALATAVVQKLYALGSAGIN